ncbi:PalH/RIM21-domain-containing protein [Tricladium varicosporioides]|nr:PalH/RIM21-domain-containing protein [Hymenoscyphus varicosporioides]
MEARQLINLARPTTSATTTRPHCTPFTLPSNGVLTLGVSSVITLTSDAVFRPECTGSTADIILTNGGSSPSAFTDFRDPFYASTIPECYALAAATVIAYMLVIMLLITPRTFLHDGLVILGRRGFTNGPSGSDAGIGIGGRPWLQKVAAMTVAISLTIATADTFKVAEKQYEIGYMDAAALQNEVEDGMELKIIRVISDTFLWLAQAQTLIRLFPRQREKIIIKWTAFALITLDVLFSILNNFVYDGNSRPRSFVDAVPALAYLFQLALSLLYSAWVIYYSITKKRYAFYHPQMKNICLVALLSLVAVLVPTVFFVLDISKPTLAGWGDYVRWVGAAAASVVVWEWVERIEALERNEKKDGVLGREVFDGDEMIDVTPSDDSSWSRRFNGKKDDSTRGGGTSTGSNGKSWHGMSSIASRYRARTSARDVEKSGAVPHSAARNANKRVPRSRPPLWPTRPAPAATPISRTDTASAESTVYAIRYHPINEETPPPNLPNPGRSTVTSRRNSYEEVAGHGSNTVLEQNFDKPVMIETSDDGEVKPAALAHVNPFRRKTQAPPPEVSAHTIKPQEPTTTYASSSRWDVRGRLEEFAATQAEKLREKSRPNVNAAPLPRTVIPAPPRRRNLQATLDELESAERGETSYSEQSQHSFSPVSTINRSNTIDSTHQYYPPRVSDPYTPEDLSRHAIHQRGAISIVTGDRDATAQDDIVSPLSDTADSRPAFSSRGTPTTIHIRTPTSPRRDGLPVMTIPAPPRPPRRNEDE